MGTHTPACERETRAKIREQYERAPKPKRQYSYDPACETLAVHFLGEENPSDERLAEFADAIQQAVESWLDANSLHSVERPVGRAVNDGL
jgi:hypothetical protein